MPQDHRPEDGDQPRSGSVADSLLSLATMNNNQSAEVSTALLMTEMHNQQAFGDQSGTGHTRTPSGNLSPLGQNLRHFEMSPSRWGNIISTAVNTPMPNSYYKGPMSSMPYAEQQNGTAPAYPNSGPQPTDQSSSHKPMIAPLMAPLGTPQPHHQQHQQHQQPHQQHQQQQQPPLNQPMDSTEPLSSEDLEMIARMFPHEFDFTTPLAPHTNVQKSVLGMFGESLPIPQFGPDYDESSLLSLLKSRPSIRTENSTANDITRLHMDRYLSAYFNFFHPIVPLFHCQTFDVRTAQPQLLFAILAIGAMLCHEEAIAQLFSYNARTILFENFEDRDKLPLAQTLVLFIIFSSYSGDMSGSEVGGARVTLVRIVDEIVQNAGLCEPNRPINTTDWATWLQEQKYVRAYFCALIAVTTLAAIFNSPSALTLETMQQELPLPCSEKLWNTEFKNETEWQNSYMQELQEIPFTKVKDLFELVDRAGDDPSANQDSVLNPFSVRILGNILFLRTSNVPKYSEQAKLDRLTNQLAFWRKVARDPYPGKGQGPMLTMANMPFLAVMNPLVPGKRAVYESPSPILSAMNCFQHPMIILSWTLLGSARLQLILDLSLVRENLNFRSAQRVAEAALTCLSSLKADEAIEDMTKVVVGSADILRAMCLLGVSMYQSFLRSPLTGSITGQCMILAFEVILGLVIWCHRVEERMAEQNTIPNFKPFPTQLKTVYHWIEHMCEKIGIQKVYGTLAPSLAEAIAELYDSIKTWRLAEVMALSLRLFARGLLNTHSARYSRPATGYTY